MEGRKKMEFGGRREGQEPARRKKGKGRNVMERSSEEWKGGNRKGRGKR